MSENTNTLSIGQDVWWKDPEGKTSGSFLVLEIKLPDTIGLSDNEDEFFITFATYCEAPTSNNGENIYTDTLIDILEYLENYRNKL